jgi:hypothetical protein
METIDFSRFCVKFHELMSPEANAVEEKKIQECLDLLEVFTDFDMQEIMVWIEVSFNYVLALY